jgi:hypothetical protein
MDTDMDNSNNNENDLMELDLQHSIHSSDSQTATIEHSYSDAQITKLLDTTHTSDGIYQRVIFYSRGVGAALKVCGGGGGTLSARQKLMTF